MILIGRIGVLCQVQVKLLLHLVKPTQQRAMAYISLLQEAVMLAQLGRFATMMSGVSILLACGGHRCLQMLYHGSLEKVTLPILFEGRCLSSGVAK
jgi:hypothetical protein